MHVVVGVGGGGEQLLARVQNNVPASALKSHFAVMLQRKESRTEKAEEEEDLGAAVATD
jgi:hypothetical protein